MARRVVWTCPLRKRVRYPAPIRIPYCASKCRRKATTTGLNGILEATVSQDPLNRQGPVMAQAAMDGITLDDLSAGMPGITPRLGAVLAEAATLCFEDHLHASGVPMPLDGDTAGHMS